MARICLNLLNQDPTVEELSCFSSSANANMLGHKTELSKFICEVSLYMGVCYLEIWIFKFYIFIGNFDRYCPDDVVSI